MKLNLGCGFNKKDGFVNVDKFDTCGPDLVMDLEVTPWRFETSEVDEVLFNHSLEHIGQSTDTFLAIIKELYRVCKGGATIQVNVPHPRHDHFLEDPTHVRAVTPEMFNMFSKKHNLFWKKVGAANSPLALYLDVDFDVKRVEHVIEPRYMDMLKAGQISSEELEVAAKERNNVVAELRITLQVLK
jgi:predicted SAM-dependent methyltransferase